MFWTMLVAHSNDIERKHIVNWVVAAFLGLCAGKFATWLLANVVTAAGFWGVGVSLVVTGILGNIWRRRLERPR